MDRKSIKPRLADWVRRSMSQENTQMQDAEEQVRAFLSGGSTSQILGPAPDQPPAYRVSEATTLHQAEAVRISRYNDGPQPTYKALPPPFRSVSQPPTIPSPVIAPHPLWNVPRPSTTSPFQPRETVASPSDVGAKGALNDRLDTLLAPYVDTIKPKDEITLDEWLRAAIWWALRGKATLARSQSTGGSNSVFDEELDYFSRETAQGLTDLGKAWWICHQAIAQDDFRIMTNDPRINSTPRGALLDQYRRVLRYLRPYEQRLETALLGHTSFATMMDLDRCIWVFYPPVTSYDAVILNDQRLAAWSIPLAFSDTDDLFCYANEFVTVTLFAQDEYSLVHSFSCVLSIVRTRSSWDTLGVIASQTHLIHVTIQSNGKQGPKWKDIEWDVGRQSMLVKLRHGLLLDVKFSEDRFKHIWEMANQRVLAEKDMVAGENEEILFDDPVNCCQYINHDKPIEFPAKPIQECRVRLFKKTATVSTGPNSRASHRGYRIFITTPPHDKTMHQVSHTLDNGSAVVYNLLDAEDGSPGLFLQVVEDNQRRSIFLYFDHPELRSLMHSLLLDLAPGPGETALQTFATSSYVILERQAPGSGTKGPRHLEFGESISTVIEQTHEPEATTNPYGKTILSVSLRVVIEADWGSVTDRINIGPGELKIGLSVLDNTVLHLHRLPQKDLTITVAQAQTSDDLRAKVGDVLNAVQAQSTLRRIKFETEKDLHRFQQAITGFKVIFDTVATRFYITRRRKLLSTLKHWDANITRIQVVQRGTKTQIVAFFHQFQLWKCVNFVVTSMDRFEKVDQKGEWGVRMREARYAVPVTDPDVSWYGFVCLDELEYPSEHDDMVFMFGQPTVREQFVACLPGPVGDAPKGLLPW